MGAFRPPVVVLVSSMQSPPGTRAASSMVRKLTLTRPLSLSAGVPRGSQEAHRGWELQLAYSDVDLDTSRSREVADSLMERGSRGEGARDDTGTQGTLGVLPWNIRVPVCHILGLRTDGVDDLAFEDELRRRGPPGVDLDSRRIGREHCPVSPGEVEYRDLSCIRVSR